MHNTVGGGPVGFEGVGVGVSLGAGSLGALQRRAWQATQEHHPIGVAALAFDQALASRARDRCRRRRRIHFPQAPRPLPETDRAHITFITRLRLDAALYEPVPPRYPGQMGRPRLKGERLSNLSNVAADPDALWSPITVA